MAETNKTVDIKAMPEEYFLTKYVGLIHYVIRRNFMKDLPNIKLNTGMEYDDLFQLGAIALIKAKRRFDNSKGIPFSSYAVPTITGEIRNYIKDSNKIKAPQKIVKIKNKIVKNNLQDMPTEKISEVLGVPESIVHDAINYYYSYDYIDKTVNTSSNKKIELKELIPDTLSENLENTIIKTKILNDFLNTLNKKEIEIWTLYNFGKKTQLEIAGIVGTSKSSVSRILRNIEEKAVKYGKNMKLQTQGVD